jgi:deoxyadenosine/deoxycytidine kinase
VFVCYNSNIVFYTQNKMEQQPIIISLDGNIGAGKSTLLAAIHDRMPHLTVIQEPVGEWMNMKNEKGESLLQLFYKDKKRWSYTFQNCAILTRMLHTKKIIQEYKPSKGKLPIIITERSILTDRYVFAEMLHKEGLLDDLEWELYMKWFDSFAADLPIKGIIHLSTSAETSQERIHIRNREGEDGIMLDYLQLLDKQHKHWIDTCSLPNLTIHTEPGTNIDDVLETVQTWIMKTFNSVI